MEKLGRGDLGAPTACEPGSKEGFSRGARPWGGRGAWRGGGQQRGQPVLGMRAGRK